MVLSSQVEIDFRKLYNNEWISIDFCSQIDRNRLNTHIHCISTPPPINPENVIISLVLNTFRIFDASAGEGSGGPPWGIIAHDFIHLHRFQKMLQKPMDFERFRSRRPPRSLPPPIFCEIEHRAAAQEIPTFSVFTKRFSSCYRMPSQGGPSRPPTSDRTPKSAQDRWCVWELYTPVCFYGARPILTVRGECGGIWF